MNIATNIAGDRSDNESTDQVPGPSAQSKSWKRSDTLPQKKVGVVDFANAQGVVMF